MPGRAIEQLCEVQCWLWSKRPPRFWFMLNFGLLILLLNICPGCLRTAPATSAIAFRHVPIGIGEDYPKNSRTITAAERDLALLKSKGVDVLRISFPWDAIEPEPGRYDWRFWDEF